MGKEKEYHWNWIQWSEEWKELVKDHEYNVNANEDRYIFQCFGNERFTECTSVQRSIFILCLYQKWINFKENEHHIPNTSMIQYIPGTQKLTEEQIKQIVYKFMIGIHKYANGFYVLHILIKVLNDFVFKQKISTKINFTSMMKKIVFIYKEIADREKVLQMMESLLLKIFHVIGFKNYYFGGKNYLKYKKDTDDSIKQILSNMNAIFWNLCTIEDLILLLSNYSIKKMYTDLEHTYLNHLASDANASIKLQIEILSYFGRKSYIGGIKSDEHHSYENCAIFRRLHRNREYYDNGNINAINFNGYEKCIEEYEKMFYLQPLNFHQNMHSFYLQSILDSYHCHFLHSIPLLQMNECLLIATEPETNTKTKQEKALNIYKSLAFEERKRCLFVQQMRDKTNTVKISDVNVNNVLKSKFTSTVSSFANFYQVGCPLSFGQDMNPSYADRINTVPRYYKNLKEELIKNPYYTLSLKYFRIFVQSSKELKALSLVYKIVNCHSSDFQHLIVGQLLNTGHLLTLQTYCNNNELQFQFKKNFRWQSMQDTNENVAKRISLIFHWSRLLLECVKCFGQMMTWGEKFYHGINKYMRWMHRNNFFSPVSCTKSKAIASLFAEESGMVISIQKSINTRECNYFNVEWLSNFKKEEERLLFDTQFEVVDTTFHLNLPILKKDMFTCFKLLKFLANGKYFTDYNKIFNYETQQMLKQIIFEGLNDKSEKDYSIICLQYKSFGKINSIPRFILLSEWLNKDFDVELRDLFFKPGRLEMRQKSGELMLDSDDLGPYLLRHKKFGNMRDILPNYRHIRYPIYLYAAELEHTWNSSELENIWNVVHEQRKEFVIRSIGLHMLSTSMRFQISFVECKIPITVLGKHKRKGNQLCDCLALSIRLLQFNTTLKSVTKVVENFVCKRRWSVWYQKKFHRSDSRFLKPIC